MERDNTDSEGAAPAAGTRSRAALWISNAAWGVFVLWAALSLATPTMNGDLWIDLKVGEDVLSGRGFPENERYAATAEHRPFVAFEWLSSLAFAVIHQAVGNPGLVVLRIVLGLGCLAFLYFALLRPVRRSGATLPLLALTNYLIVFRAHVRPHLFSLLIISALCFALERWRRTRRPAELLWLIPLHCLWANLHGAFLFGIVLLGAVAGVVGALALFPQLRGPGEAEYTGNDFFLVAGVALASLSASLVNPYGIDILGLSLRISESSEFIKTVISEWRSPFVTGQGHPWFAIYLVMLALVWGSLLLRLRERPWLDALIAGLVTYQSIRANRFVPYLAIYGFPILARGAHQLARGAVGAATGRLRTGAELAFMVFMLVTSVGPLASGSPRHRRELGFGVTGRLPFEEVQWMRKRQLAGTIFNEYEDGAVIIYYLHPRVRPVMDARIDMYGPALYWDWHKAKNDPDKLLKYLDKHEIDLALLARWKMNRPLLEALHDAPDWRQLYRFEKRILFIRERKTSQGPNRSSAPGPARARPGAG